MAMLMVRDYGADLWADELPSPMATSIVVKRLFVDVCIFI